jgi:hypothetical protein
MFSLDQEFWFCSSLLWPSSPAGADQMNHLKTMTSKIID